MRLLGFAYGLYKLELGKGGERKRGRLMLRWRDRAEEDLREKGQRKE